MPLIKEGKERIRVQRAFSIDPLSLFLGINVQPQTQLVTKNNDAILLFVTSDIIKIIENVTF